MHDGSLDLQKTRITYPAMRKNFATVYSTHATWAPKIPVQKREEEQKNWQKLLGGMPSICASNVVTILNSRSYHTDLNMDTVVTAVRNLFAMVTGIKPRFRAHGGTSAENLALQNIQVSSVILSRETIK